MTASKKFSDEYLEYLTTLIAQLDRSAISQFADLLLQSRENKTTTFFLGNGGSASTATHFVNDVSLGSRQFEKPFRAISLCDNQAVITAIANDDDYISLLHFPCCGAIKRNISRFSFPLDYIGFKAFTIVNVNNLDLFSCNQVGCIHQFSIYGDAANII